MSHAIPPLSPDLLAEGVPPVPDTGEDFRIELAEVPLPEPRRTVLPGALVDPPVTPRSLVIPLPVEPTVVAEDAERLADEEEDPEPSLWRRFKRLMRPGYFNPFLAFQAGADTGVLVRGQLFLFMAAFLVPLVMLSISSLVMATVFHVGAAINGSTPPNTFFEAAFYPLVYIFAKGYWLAYAVLPLLVMATGWIWAALSAWNLSRDSRTGFAPLFSILAMTGSMLAPFALFPILRLLAFGLILMYVARRLKGYFHFEFGLQAARAGSLLVVLAVGYAIAERKVEASYSANADLGNDLQDYYFHHRKLEWPRFVARIASPNDILLEQLGSLDPDRRARASERAMRLLGSPQESPELRFRLASRMADFGHVGAMAYLSRACRSGQGTPVDLSKSLFWMGEVLKAEPANMDYALEEAALCFQANRPLDGKRHYVALAKRNIKVLARILDHMKRSGVGVPDPAFQWDVQNLYQGDASQCDVPRYRSYSSRYGTSDFELSLRERLLQRLTAPEIGPSQWFWRALVTEHGSTQVAGPIIYGETVAEGSLEDLQERLAANEPAALDQAGDRVAKAGDLPRARDYWRKAILAFNGDRRRPNAAIYLKLAQSHEGGAPSSEETQEAIRGYLGFLLLNEDSLQANRKILQTLKTLGVTVREDADLAGLEFLTLCAKYDLPEAWAIMGSSHAAGFFAGHAKNPTKAKECFDKARKLGYQGPVVAGA